MLACAQLARLGCEGPQGEERPQAWAPSSQPSHRLAPPGSLQACQRWPGHAPDPACCRAGLSATGVGRPSLEDLGEEVGVAAEGAASGTRGEGVEGGAGSRQPLKGLQVGRLSK